MQVSGSTTPNPYSCAMASPDIAEQFASGGWQFTSDVVDVFDEHVAASVPHYAVIQRLVAEMADWLLPHGGIYADLGASTGTTAQLIGARHPDRTFRAFLYDEVPEMLEQAALKLDGTNVKVERKLQTILKPMDHTPADLTTALFTLQFLPPERRAEVLAHAHRASRATGALIVAEKVRPADPFWAEIAMEASHDFKSEAGISDTAIRAKARSLRGVLRPSSIQDLLATITCAGWQRPETLFRWHQWVVVGAFAT